MTTKAEDTKPELDPHARNPQIAVGRGEQLGPDLLKIEPDGTVVTVEGVPDPPYDLNEWGARAEPLDEEPKGYFELIDEAHADDDVDPDTGAKTAPDHDAPKKAPAKKS